MFQSLGKRHAAIQAEMAQPLRSAPARDGVEPRGGSPAWGQRRPRQRPVRQRRHGQQAQDVVPVAPISEAEQLRRLPAQDDASIIVRPVTTGELNVLPSAQRMTCVGTAKTSSEPPPVRSTRTTCGRAPAVPRRGLVSARSSRGHTLQSHVLDLLHASILVGRREEGLHPKAQHIPRGSRRRL